MKEILKHLKPYKSRLAIVALMHLIATVSSLLMPYVMSTIVDNGIKEKDRNVIISSAVFMLVLALVSLTTSFISIRMNTAVTTSFSSSLCKTMFKKTNSLSLEQYSKIGSSGLLTRSTDDIFNIEGAASEFVYTVVTVPIMLIGGSVLAFISDWVLSLIFIVSIPPVLVFISFLVKPLYKMWDKADEYIDVQNRIVRERLAGIRVVRAFNNEAKEHKRAKFATEEMSKYIIKSNVRSGYITPIVLLLLDIATVVMLWLGAVRVESAAISDAGSVIAAIQYVGLISNAVLTLSWTIAWIPHLKVSVKRISEVLCLEKNDESADDIKNTPELSTDGAEIEISGLTFSYPDSQSPTLTDISMKINKGETVAVIGGTGCGKTTLLRLLLNFYTPDSGEIKINGQSYTDLSKNEVRSYFSVALQKGMIFEGTVRNNITMGKKSASDDEIMAAASDCMLADFISEKKEGLDYLLVGMGQNVSGGQKQRINMTRAIIRDASVYAFDDSFSALDYLTERKIQHRLFDRLQGKTKLIITQRVSTALASDKIYVMDRGRVVACGTHSELISSSNIYREICISQLGSEAVGGGDANG
jgi:ATP-binding cassette subfamily B protein